MPHLLFFSNKLIATIVAGCATFVAAFCGCVQVHSFVLRICTESGLYTYKSCASGHVAAINVKSKGENVADNFG